VARRNARTLSTTRSGDARVHRVAARSAAQWDLGPPPGTRTSRIGRASSVRCSLPTRQRDSHSCCFGFRTPVRCLDSHPTRASPGRELAPAPTMGLESGSASRRRLAGNDGSNVGAREIRRSPGQQDSCASPREEQRTWPRTRRTAIREFTA
jgi:hypothetical protein